MTSEIATTKPETADVLTVPSTTEGGLPNTLALRWLEIL
jgi:hypothetical protein